MRFNAIRPGFIATEIMEGIPRDSAVYDSYIENTPMGDVGEPEDVGHLARFLVGPESRWITGQLHRRRRRPLPAPRVRNSRSSSAGLSDDVLHGALPD